MAYTERQKESAIIENILFNNPNLKLGFSMLRQAEYVTPDGRYATQLVARELDPSVLNVKVITTRGIAVHFHPDVHAIMLENAGDAKYLHPYDIHYLPHINKKVGDVLTVVDNISLQSKDIVVTEEMCQAFQSCVFRFALS
jgi:hypothetical protein